MTVVLGYAAYTFALGGLAAWMPTFLEPVRGVPKASAATNFGEIVVVTGFVGTFAGGWLADYLLRHSRQAYLWFSGAVTLLAAPVAYLALASPEREVYLPAIVVAELLLFMSTGPINAAIINIVSPLERASAGALSMFVIHLLGDVPSPLAHRPYRRRQLARPRRAHRPGRGPHRRPRLARLRARGTRRAGQGVKAARTRTPKSVSPAARPLAHLARADLAARLDAALKARAGEEGAHCIHELWMRGEFSTHIEAALEALWRVAAPSVPEWLPMRYIDFLPRVYEVALGFSARGRGRTQPLPGPARLCRPPARSVTGSTSA